MISEAAITAAFERMRAAGGFEFESTGRQSKAFIWRDGEIYLELGEDGALYSAEKVTEAQVRETIAKRPGGFAALLRP